MNEGFGGIKRCVAVKRHTIFVDRFERQAEVFAYAREAILADRAVPRYFMELVALALWLFLVLLLISYTKGT